MNGIKLTIDKKSSIAEMLRSNRKSAKEIACETGVSTKTVYRIKKELNDKNQLQAVKKTGKQIEKEIARLIYEGFSMKKISETLMVTKGHIKKVAETMRDDDLEYAPNNEDFLRKNWRWIIPAKGRPHWNPKTNCRIVYVGERTNFRTPYRPDGIWR